MRATYTPEQLEIERTMLAVGENGLDEARACLEHGWSPRSSDGELLADFGALGLPEAAGGFGSSLTDAAIAVEALARTLVPTLLPAHLAAVLTAAAAGIDVTPAVDGNERWSLTAGDGARRDAPYAGTCDAVVLVDGDDVTVVPGDDAAQREPVDPTRPVGTVSADASATASGTGSAPLARATVLVAADLCGTAAGAVALGAAYAADREQFGRPIGSFQGVAFQLAEAFIAARAAWDLTLYAAWAVDVADESAGAHVHAAKAKAGQAAVFAAERALQVHGGIGMTMEANPHLFLRRALFDDAWLGGSREHRRALGRLRVAATA